MAEPSTPPDGWLPPDEERVPINVHPEAREALRTALMHDPRLKGVGYSAFIMRALASVGEGHQLTPLHAKALLVALNFGVPDPEPSEIAEARAVLRALAGPQGGDDG